MTEEGSDLRFALYSLRYRAKKNNQENVHSATDPQKCRDMGEKYGWKLEEAISFYKIFSRS